ncbi:MAG: hypothetical protein FWG98_11665 [Candidatus Cloacimonetes bacterium]|nr:hypothetical protein [Candidatus Cloacimonadota bacterium]
MEKFKLIELSKKTKVLPQKSGLFVLYSKDKALFVKSTENLNRFINFYCDENSEDDVIQELVKQVEHVEYMENDLLIGAFLEEILFINKYNPPFNKMIKPWYKYSYLGINFEKPPYFKVCDDTTEDFYFLGPFRSAFVLNDILDVFADLFKMPRCSNETFERSIEQQENNRKNVDKQNSTIYGCERLQNELCLGFCQNRLGEALPEMTNRMMMLPNKELINKLNIEYEALLNDLLFQKADDLTKQIELLKRYYKHVLFFYTSQFIEGDFKIQENQITVSEGMIIEGMINKEKIKYSCPQSENIPYNLDFKKKNNELLAFDKSEFDHRWIIFNFLCQTQPDYIEQLFLENIEKIQKSVFCKEGQNINNEVHKNKIKKEKK